MPLEVGKITLITAIAGAIFGFVGTVLGILNTWRVFDRDRVRLRVVPRVYVMTDAGFLTAHSFDALDKQPNSYGQQFKTFRRDAKDLCIEVANLSLLPVTISGVGFITDAKRSRLGILRPIEESTKLPHRLEALSSVTIYGAGCDVLDQQLLRIKKAYCETACGRTFYGTSPALKEVIRRQRQRSAPQPGCA